MTEYGYEIDFLPVGNGDKSGDAIIIRYRLNEDYKIMVVDGGTKESGEEIVRHIKKYYNTDRVDYLVNTHPDADHASGLEVVLEELQVGEVWVHRPWVHPHKIRHLFKDGRITDNSLSDRLKRACGTHIDLKNSQNRKILKLMNRILDLALEYFAFYLLIKIGIWILCLNSIKLPMRTKLKRA
ncbi:MBL fold metallo-hydrolase [Cardiobacterium hominis]|uniref:MBL fold metallo-hydrolase n=1 Tax=Cardiobacterium hominis TaxID=2718 RepID=UPI0028EEE902|nr:MBL fold metallo-hydrolase [Cardiobacterium hominis]